MTTVRIPELLATRVLCMLSALLLCPSPLPAQQAGPPANRPPALHPPHGHDRSNIPPRANPDPPGRNGDGPARNDAPHALAARLTGAPQAAVAVASVAIAGALRRGTLIGSARRANATPAQRSVLDLMESSEADLRPIVAALCTEPNRQARTEATRLARSLRGLFDEPARLPDAVLAYNALVDASSAAFLRNPPAEFVAIRAALTPLVQQAQRAAGNATIARR